MNNIAIIPGKIGDEEGHMISYNDFEKLFNLPKGYYFEGIEDQGEEVLFRFVEEKVVKKDVNGMFTIGEFKHHFMKKNKEDVVAKLNIHYDTFAAWLFVREQGNCMKRFFPFVTAPDLLLIATKCSFGLLN